MGCAKPYSPSGEDQSETTWGTLSPAAKLLYCMLCVLCDRLGLCAYGDRRLTQVTGLTQARLQRARAELEAGDFIARDTSSTVVQVLSLPSTVQRRGWLATDHKLPPPAPLSRLTSARHVLSASPSSATPVDLAAIRQFVHSLTSPDRGDVR
jgi:hypothetical protein